MAEPFVASSTQEALERAMAEMGEEVPETPAEPEVAEVVADAPETQEAAPEPSDGPARHPDGKFAPKAVAEAPEAAPVAPVEPVTGAPAGFHAQAQADWAKTPASVRGETERRMREIEGGLERYRQTVEPLKPFLDMTGGDPRQLAGALQNYIGIENTLKADPVKGLELVCQNMGTTLRDIAARVMGQPAPEKDAVIEGLRSELAAVKQQVGTVHQTFEQQRYAAAANTVQAFWDAHPRANELANDIKRALETGWVDRTDPDALRKAYEFAERLNPAPAPGPQTPAPITAPAPQTRKSSLSIQGAPGSNPGTARIVAKSVDEALQMASQKLGMA